MANDWDGEFKNSPKRIELRIPITLLGMIDKKCSRDGISRNEMLCRLLSKAIRQESFEGGNETSNNPSSKELSKHVFELHYMISHQYGKLKGRRMDSLALEASAETKKKMLMMEADDEEDV